MLHFTVPLRQLLSGAHEARERCAVSGRQPIPRQPFSGADELRSNTLFMGGSPFLGTLYMVQPSRVSDTPLPGWGFRRLRAAGERRSRAGPKRVDNLRFSTLLGSSPFPSAASRTGLTALLHR